MPSEETVLDPARRQANAVQLFGDGGKAGRVAVARRVLGGDRHQAAREVGDLVPVRSGPREDIRRQRIHRSVHRGGTAEQKRDILYNNAARFLRLSEQEQARHRER
ncbi:MAG: hypothetical protein DMF79_06775 [Acidobacteria bacterium]|nr:MAG: hypothetical protein DMF79_06775 [Acidobacteriota bacterium]